MPRPRPYRITQMIAHPLQKHTGGYIFVIVFRPSIYHRGYVEYHTPFGRTPHPILSSKVLYPVGTIHPQHARTGVDTGTSMDTGTSREATAVRHHSGPIEPATWTPAVPVAAPPRAGITSIFSGFTPAIGTGTASTAVVQTPTAGTRTSEVQGLWQQRPSHRV